MPLPTALLVTPLPFAPTKSTPTEGSTPLHLPTDGQQDWLEQQIGGGIRTVAYHLDASVHVNSDTVVLGQQPNPVLWTLACAWRDRLLPHGHQGPALITGHADFSGTYLPLSELMANQTQQALKAATDWWLEHDYDIPLWPINPSSHRFAKAVAVTQAAL
ncbi:hypothetical protein ACWF9B_00625 [Streptomyces sp. NPDC055089]